KLKEADREGGEGVERPRSCGFVLPRTVCKREITREEALVYVRNGRSELLTDFTSRYGRPFSATLVLRKNGRHGFEFPPRPGRKGADGAGAEGSAGAAAAADGEAAAPRRTRRAASGRKRAEGAAASDETVAAKTRKPARKKAGARARSGAAATRKRTARKPPTSGE